MAHDSYIWHQIFGTNGDYPKGDTKFIKHDRHKEAPRCHFNGRGMNKRLKDI